MTSKVSVPSILIAIAAGLASGVMFASLVGGSLLTLPLFLAAPMPLVIATLGWGWPAGVLAAFVAVAGIQVGVGTHAGLAMLFAVALPAVIPAHLAGRSVVDATGATRWYPIGALLAAMTVLVAMITVLGGIGMDFDPVATAALLVTAFHQTMVEGAASGASVPDMAQLEPFVRGTVRLMPAFFPATWLVVLVFDLWLGAKAVALSGRLRRPADDLSAVDLPIAAGLLFGVSAVVAVFVPGPLGLIAEVVAGALFAAHFLVGLAVLHAVTRATDMRPILLAFAYGVVLLFTLPAALVALVGVFEPFLGLRRRAPPPRPR